MRKSNSILIGVIGVLLAANLVLSFSKNRGTSVGYDEAQFALTDTSAVSSITIGEIDLRKKDRWFIADFPADPAFVDHLLNVMSRVRIKKPVGNAEGGTSVKVNGELLFDFSSNATKTKTIFSKDDSAYEMEIPGFTDYVGGIFELNEDQWRDRLVFNGSWRTIQRISVDYQKTNDADFEIRFKDQFFEIEGVDQVDTTAVMNFLNQFQYFQANERISPGRISSADSIVTTTPLAVLRIEDINYQEPLELRFFPSAQDQAYHLVLDQNGEMVAIDPPRTARILKSKSEFVYQK